MKKRFFVGGMVALMLSLTGFGSLIPNAVAAEEPTPAAPEIKPLVHYEFDDPNNLGKDSMGMFDLLDGSSRADGVVQKSEGEGGNLENYASFTSARNEDGSAAAGGGGRLYAPELSGTRKDFSDLIDGSYSVELTFRRDNSLPIGDHYVLSVGRWNNAFQITPWWGGIQVQIYHMNDMEGNTLEEKQEKLSTTTIWLTDIDTTAWTTLLVSANAETKLVNFYVNGQPWQARLPDGVTYVDAVPINHVEMTYKDNNLSFSLGAAGTYTGDEPYGWSTVDIADCKVFDYALTAENAAALYAGQAATFAGEKYIAELEQFDGNTLDLMITDLNSKEKIVSEVLPKRIETTLNDGTSVAANVFWMDDGAGKFLGYVQSSYENPSQLQLRLAYGYTCRFDYDEDMVTITDIKLDKEAYVPGTVITPDKHSLQFKIEVKPHYTLESVSYAEVEWEADENGVYAFSFKNGACVVVEAQKTQYSLSYYDGDTLIETIRYTYGETVTLAEGAEKDGYAFEGWYADVEYTRQVTEIDTSSPENITLYAKYTKTGGCSGCGSSISGGLMLSLVGAFVPVLLCKRKKR